MRRIINILAYYGIFDAIPLALVSTAVYTVIRIIYLNVKKSRGAGVPAELARGVLVWYMASLVVVVWFTELPKLFLGNITFAEFKADTFFRGEYVINGRFWRIANGQLWALRDFELLANIALFVPYGILLPLAFRGLKWWAVDLIALGTTAVIEVFQPMLGRACDLDDVIANTLGGVIGCIMAKLVITAVAHVRKDRAEDEM